MNLQQVPILSIVAYIPLAGALLLIFFFPKEKAGPIKAFATIVAGLDFLVSLALWFALDRAKAGYQFVERVSWIPSLGVEYHFGIDGISLVLLLLTTFIGFIAVYSSYTAISQRQKEYYVLMLLGIIALYFTNTTGFRGYRGLNNPATFSIEKLTAVAAGMPVDLQIWVF